MTPHPLHEEALDLEALARLAEEVAREAGGLLLGYYEGGGPSRRVPASASAKSSRTDPVTEADTASERLIVSRIAAARPHDGVMGEEGGGRAGTSGLTWVVDPLDGTVNFVYGFPAFAVSIACVAGAPETAGGGEQLVGAVFDPVRDEAFVAVRSRGATRNGIPLHLAPPPPLPEALVATGFGYGSDRRRSQAELLTTVLPAVRDVRRAGAAALDLCWLAAGRVDAFYEAGLAPWDFAAGALVVTEAGGEVGLVDGVVEGASTVVAAARPLRAELVELLREARAAAREQAAGPRDRAGEGRPR